RPGPPPPLPPPAPPPAGGALIGYIVAKIIVFAQDDPLLEVAMSTIVAYMAFLVADKCFAFSGVMSVMGAGVVMAHYGAARFTPEVKQYMKNFWSFMSFVANSLIFLLLGFTEEILLLNKGEFINVLLYVLAAVLAVQIARAVVVFGFCPWYGRRRLENKISLPYQLVMFWGGLRGAVPLALVFGLPADLPGRELIVQITLGVVLFTVLIQGMTVKPLMSKFKLDQPDGYTRFAAVLAKFFMKQRSCRKLESTELKYEFNSASLDDLRLIYRRDSAELQQNLQKMITAAPENINLVRRAVWLQAAISERNSMEERFCLHVLNEGAYYRINAAIEAQFEWILNQPAEAAKSLPKFYPKLKSAGWLAELATKRPMFRR
ncbi:MAG: cation:proton antiporter, partial [Victivallaceae bacterium]